MKILAITQARYGSTRLPGKVLKKIGDKTLLELHISRILQSKKITKLKIATTLEPDAFRIEEIATLFGVEVYKGSIDDVLERFYFTALPENPDWVVRLTSDCPLIDSHVIDDVICKAIDSEADYISNTLTPTFPDGIDVEVFKFSALQRAYNDAVLRSDREHVTPYIWRNSSVKGGNLFQSLSFEYKRDYSSYRLTVDKPEDLEVIKQLVANLGTDRTWNEYIDFLDKNLAIKLLNQNFKRNEGYQKSLNEDNK